MRLSLARAVAIADKRQMDGIISNLFNSPVADILRKMPEGEPIGEKALSDLFKQVAKEAAPLIAHWHGKNERAGERNQNEKPAD